MNDEAKILPCKMELPGEINRLLVAAKMLLQNGIGCAVNHYGNDIELHGTPGWLIDCEKDIENAESAISAWNKRQVEGGEAKPVDDELEALRKFAHEATIAITGLTGGGSEFFGKRVGDIYLADLPFCVQRIRETRESLFETMKEAKREANGSREALEFVRLVNLLRADEGNSVEILCDNPDFNGQPNCAVVCNGDWTNWHDRRFTGDTLLEALTAAIRSLPSPHARSGK